MFFLPYSPRWLLEQNRNEDARETLRKLHFSPKFGYDEEWLELEYKEISDQIEIERSNRVGGIAELKELFTKRAYLHRIMLGCGIQAMGQFTGINVINYCDTR